MAENFASNPESPPRGVMDARYGAQRRALPHVAFRLRSRALAAVEAIRAFADPYALEEMTLLDLGAAEGATLDLVHRALGSRDSIGIEYARDLIARASDLSAGVRLVEGDATRAHPEVAAESRQVVLALAILEHLESPSELFAEAHRALRPGGLLVATAPSGFWDELSGLLRLHPEEHHEDAVTRASFDALAEANGLEPVLYRRFMNAPLAFLPYLRIPVSPRFAARVDAGLNRLRVFEFGFVNQLFVARKPYDKEEDPR
ncbi:MAG: class I SAM-dependent methyltransferase [Myxococcota bacterium]